MNKTKKRTASARGSDPLEIKQEIPFDNEDIEIKNEPIGEGVFYHTYFLKEEKFGIESESDPLLYQTESYPPGIERIVDINDLLRKNKDTTLNSSALLPEKESISPMPEYLENKIKKQPSCENCMLHIEHFCIFCKKSRNYHKDTTLCSNCQSTLKLRCKICHRRFKFLSKLHQYVLQASKQLNLLSHDKKQVTFTCDKTQNFVCSKCKYQTTQKEQLIKHMEKLHGQTGFTNLYTKSASHNQVTTNKSIISKILSKPNKAESVNMPTIKNFIVNSPSTISNLNNQLNISKNIQNLLQEVTQVKAPKKAKNSKKKPEVNSNEDDDQYIELFCPECKKHCKKIVYDEIMKPVCRECQQLMIYRCTMCTSQYKLLKYARLHAKRYGMNGPKLNCIHCDYKVDVKSRLDFHIQSEHTPRNCIKCNTEFKNAAALKLHVIECAAVKNNKRVDVHLSQESDLDDVPLIIRQNELMLKNYRNEKVPIDNDDSYTIIENNPEVLMNEINKTLKDINKDGWTALVDYYCLQCDTEAKQKFSKYKPRCPKCKEKYDYRCVNCEKLYWGYNNIYKHVKHEFENLFEKGKMGCRICNYTSRRKYLLLNHIKNKHAIYKCLRCNCRCEGYLSLRKHQSTDCKIDNPHGMMHLKKLIARYCKYCCKRSIGLHDDNELVPCDRCTVIMDFQCLKCNKIFDNREFTYKHVKEECRPTFLCDKCDYKAYIQYDLDIHAKYVHTTRKCEDCGVWFKNEYIFRLHRIEEQKKNKLQKKQSGNAALTEPKRRKKST